MLNFVKMKLTMNSYQFKTTKIQINKLHLNKLLTYSLISNIIL